MYLKDIYEGVIGPGTTSYGYRFSDKYGQAKSR